MAEADDPAAKRRTPRRSSPRRATSARKGTSTTSPRRSSGPCVSSSSSSRPRRSSASRNRLDDRRLRQHAARQRDALVPGSPGARPHRLVRVPGGRRLRLRHHDRRRPRHHGSGKPGRLRRGRQERGLQHPAPARAVAERLHHAVALLPIPLLRHPQDAPPSARQGARRVSGRLRHARRAFRDAHAHPDREDEARAGRPRRRAYWEKLINWQFLAAQGTIDAADLDLFLWADTGAEAWRTIVDFYGPHPLASACLRNAR